MPDDYEKIVAPRAEEELHQSLPAPVTFGTSPDDGMPMQMGRQNYDIPPGLSEESLICMEDKRSFVIRNSDGSVWVSFEPREVKRLPNGEYYVEGAELRAKISAGSLDVDFDVSPLQPLGELSYLALQVRREGKLGTVVRVEPVRPACAHYLRMQTDFTADRDKRFMQRACMAQKTEDGEYYSVRDARIVACNIRSPRHIESEAVMDEFDDGKIKQAREREAMGKFDVDAELAAEAGKLGVLG